MPSPTTRQVILGHYPQHYRIDFVSIKLDGHNLGNLPQCPSGKFDLLHGANNWGKYKVPFQQALFNAEIGVEGC